MDWDPDFIERSKMLEPLRAIAMRLRGYAGWPARDDLQRLLAERAIQTGGGATLSVVAPGASGISYESRIYLHGEMQYREGEWHDFFNVLAWLAYPHTKAALNAAHHLESVRVNAAPGSNVNRSRARDALTVFDESGAIVAASDAELLHDLEGFHWKRLFCERRGAVDAHMRVHLFGHALFEKALNPYVGMTAHALLLPVAHEVIIAPAPEQLQTIDRLAASRIAGLATPQALSPLPLLGVPGWWPANADPGFYDDETHFRPGRARVSKTTGADRE